MRSLLTIVVLWVTIMMAPTVFAGEEQQTSAELLVEQEVEQTINDVAGTTMQVLAERAMEQSARELDGVVQGQAAQIIRLKSLRGGPALIEVVGFSVDVAERTALQAQLRAATLRIGGVALRVLTFPVIGPTEINTNIISGKDEQRMIDAQIRSDEDAAQAAAEATGTLAVAAKAVATPQPAAPTASIPQKPKGKVYDGPDVDVNPPSRSSTPKSPPASVTPSTKAPPKTPKLAPYNEAARQGRPGQK